MYYVLFFLLMFFSIYGVVSFLNLLYCSFINIISRKQERVRIWTPK